MIEEYLAVPFETTLLGLPVTVKGVDLTDRDEIVAICTRGHFRQAIPILDLVLPSPSPPGAEWIEAYRSWAGKRLIAHLSRRNVPKSGMIVPNMGRKTVPARTGLADALFSSVQKRVLALLFGQPERRFQSAQLIRLAGSGTGAVHRQLSRLAEAGWVTVDHTGNQKHYRANRACPAFAELHGLIVKTVGVVEPLRQALAPKMKEIRAAFVYGSVAKGTDKAASDIDLMVISDRLGYQDVFKALQSVETMLARPVNPNVMSLAEWRAKRVEKDSFAARIAAQPRLFVIGSDVDIP